MKLTQLAILITAVSLVYSVSHARERGVPPRLAEQLTESQINQLKSATSRQEKRQLLEQWGIERPNRPPRPELNDADQSKMDELKERFRNAGSQEEKEEIRKEMHILYSQSMSDDEKQQVRQFFKDNRQHFQGRSGKRSKSYGSGSAQ